MTENKINNPKTICARVLAYRDKDGKREFLIIEGNTGRFALIGGKKDKEDQSLEETIKREFLEEVGFKITDEKIIKTGIIREFTYTAHNGRMGETATDLNYIIKLDPNAQLKKTEEINNFHWMTFEEACEKISFDNLRDIFIKLQELL